jgi:hypothetical protein
MLLRFSKSMYTHIISVPDDAALITRVMKELVGGWHVVAAQIPCGSFNNPESLDAQLHALSQSSPPGTLTVLVAQCAVASVLALSRQRKACSDVRSSSVWSVGQQQQLREVISEAHKATFICHLSEMPRGDHRGPSRLV